MLAFVFSCNSRQGHRGSPDALYAQYTVTAGEGDSLATCLLRFFAHRADLRSLLLEAPAGVQFDGEPVPPDSTGMTGAYYEVRRPLALFSGRHVIQLTGIDGSTYENSFTFTPFTLLGEAGDAGSGLQLQISGLPTGTPVRVVLTDTSFASPDVNRVVPVSGGRLVLDTAAMRRVVPGPVVLNLILEEEKPLAHPPAGGGRFSLTYRLTRQLQIKAD